MKEKNASNEIKKCFDALYSAFGPQGWWPGRTRFEMIVGAILTQNTAWTNVEKAIGRLKASGVLAPEKMRRLDISELAELIRPAGYFNIKAKRLKSFLAHLFENHGGSLDRLLKKRDGLRTELLSINGIGPETADSIMLYAGGHPEFVVDAYTKRIFTRHGLLKNGALYDEIKALFTGNLPEEPRLFNEYHALIVRTGKDFCRKKEPLCEACPLKDRF